MAGLSVACGSDAAGPSLSGATTASTPAPSASPGPAPPSGLSAAVSASGSAPVPAGSDAYPFLPGETPHALSIGTTSSGRLVEPVAVVAGGALRILPRQRRRGLNYATSALADMLREAAQALHAATGRRLFIGHLSAREGGAIPYSVSHTNGRDADIAFCYCDDAGAAVVPPDLVAVGPTGHTLARPWQLDAACTWQTVKALVASSRAQVQYLFISGSLEGLLLRHARAAGEPEDLLARAEAVMMQPTGAAPHHDHLHLRIHCSRRDVLGGCQHLGVKHPFSRLFENERRAFVAQLIDQSHAGPASARQLALARLGYVGRRTETGVVDALRRGLDDPAVGLAAAQSLARIGIRDHVVDRRLPRRLRLAAVALWRATADIGAVPTLIRLRADPAFRGVAQAALAHLTNRDINPWKPWWEDMKALDRRRWLIAGFRANGFDVRDLSHRYSAELLRALASGAPHIQHNAAATLHMLYAPVDDTLRGHGEAVCRRWQRWLQRRREVDEIPVEVFLDQLCRSTPLAGP